MKIQSIKKYIGTFWRYKGLLQELVSRDLKVKYRRSALGYVWSILNPLLMMLVISTVFSYMFKNQIENYPVYLICGQVIYNFFSDATNQSMNSILSGGQLIKKVHLPKYIFPLARILSSFVNLLFSLVAVLMIVIITKTPITPVILLFPLPLIYLFLISLGVGLVLSTMAVYFRDVIHLYSVFLTALMYCTPIFYPVSSLPPEILPIIKLNPLYHVVTMFRNIVFYGNFPTLKENLICIAFSIVSLAIGLIVFKKNQDNLVLNI